MDTKSKDKNEKVEDKKQSKIEDYLTGPRKKRKNFVIFALGEAFDIDLAQAMDDFIKKNYPQLSTSKPKNPQDLTRQFGRNISLLIIDDNFDDIHIVLGLVKALKEKRRSETIPVLFMTRNAPGLIALYHKELLLYHETDEYIVYPGIQKARVCARIKVGIEDNNKRRSRRYTVFIPVTFFHLSRDTIIEGHLVDLSLHGAVLEAESDVIFRAGDQIKISLPIADHYEHTSGDFIKVSARVRRVFISGTKVSISFEHVSDRQLEALTHYLTNLVAQQMHRQALRVKNTLAHSHKYDT